MKKTILLVVILLASSFSILSASDYKNYKRNINVETNQTYVNECASCHMAFQAQFLPKRSWNKMMDTLENHFGVDATLEKIDEDKIRKYLVDNSSDSRFAYGEMAEFANSISRSSTPLAISEVPKFKREHRKISKRLISQKEVKSISNCLACHTDAKEGLYRERNILIPNYGRWDD